jgi:hypothetical protein
MEAIMSNGEAFRAYGRMSAEDRRAFDRWLTANAVIGSIFAGALLLMALAETHVAGPSHAAANGRVTTEQGVRGDQRSLSPHELTIRLAPDQLPAQQFDAF